MKFLIILALMTRYLPFWINTVHSHGIGVEPGNVLRILLFYHNPLIFIRFSEKSKKLPVKLYENNTYFTVTFLHLFGGFCFSDKVRWKIESRDSKLGLEH